MKKAIAALLSLAFILGLPITAAMAETSVSNFAALQEAVNTAENGVEKTIQLSADVTDMTACLDIPANKIITIDLNGHSIDRCLLQATADGYVIRVNSGATLNVQGDVGDMITGGYNTGYGGGVYNAGTFTLSGGRITGNAASGYGGGVYNAGTFTMSGGSFVTYNTLSGSGSKGGGVYNCAGSIFTMSCSDLGNSITKKGIISQNTADYGAGVYNAGIFTMTGGQISFNTADYGGGVGNWGTMNLSDTVIIQKNNSQDGKTNNLTLLAGQSVHVTGALSANSKICFETISDQSGIAPAPGVATAGYGKTNNSSADALFIYDGGGNYAAKRLLGEIRVIDVHTSTEEFLCNSLTTLVRHVAKIELMPQEEIAQYDLDGNELLAVADIVLLARELDS